jgi:hypothetical protein
MRISRMKKFQFLLLDAGPIIKLFEIGLWEKFIERCYVTIARTVVEEAVHTGQRGSLGYIDFPFEKAAEQGSIQIIDVAPPTIQSFLQNSKIGLKYAIHDGEAETLAFLENSSENFILCTADSAVFSALGFLDKAEKGISLEEVLHKVGLVPSQKLEWQYRKKFREKYTQLGGRDFIQDKDLK